LKTLCLAVTLAAFVTGYELNLVRGWIAPPELTYSPASWAGIALQKAATKLGAAK
jgi:hypothetical protein